MAEPCNSVQSAMWVNLALCEMSPTDRVMHASIVGVRSVLPMMVSFVRSFASGLLGICLTSAVACPEDDLNLVRGSAGSCRLRDVCSICASAPLDHDKSTR